MKCAWRKHQSRTKKSSDITVPLELVDQQGRAFSSAPLVSDRVFDLNLVENSPIVKFYQEGITDGALGGVVIVNTEALVFHTVDLGAESVDPWVGSGGVSAIKQVNL